MKDTPATATQIIDVKFRHHRGQYVIQCLVATVTILVVLFVLDTVSQTVLIASLAASSFIAFTMPHTVRSSPRYLLGGYVVGTVVGCSLSLLGSWVSPFYVGDPHTLEIIFGALATGIAIFVMVTTNTEHPPAAALALGFVLNEWDLMTLIVVFGGISLIWTGKRLAKPLLIDLL